MIKNYIAGYVAYCADNSVLKSGEYIVKRCISPDVAKVRLEHYILKKEPMATRVEIVYCNIHNEVNDLFGFLGLKNK